MAITASELRIGNFINKSIKNGNGKILVRQITPYDILNIYEDESRYNFEPITITEEWLLKFGFENDGYDHWNGPEYFELAKKTNGEWINSVNCYEYDHGVPIKYIHQLQNLYFALTGKELIYGNNPD